VSVEQETKEIEAGRRVTAFLEDEAVKGALIALEQRYFADFKVAKTPQDREALHARCVALEELFASCLGIKDRGTLAEHTRTQRTAIEEREAARRNPRNR
jgi:hypothetical protein